MPPSCLSRAVQLVQRILEYEFSRYLSVSVLALGVDTSIYSALSIPRLIPPPEASAIGYASGLIIAYFLLSRRVFEAGWLSDHKRLEFALFILSGVLGLALTYASVRTYFWGIGEQLLLAKLAAVSVSFFGVYLFRKFIVFSQNGRIGHAILPKSLKIKDNN